MGREAVEGTWKPGKLIYKSEVAQCVEVGSLFRDEVRFPMMPLWFLSISRLCLRAVHLASHIAAVSLRQRAVRVVVVNNGGIGRRIIISRHRRGFEHFSAGPGSLPGPAVLDSQQAAVGETNQTRKVGLGQRGAGCRRAEAREHRARVERGPVPAAPARSGGEAQAPERCGLRLKQQ